MSLTTSVTLLERLRQPGEQQAWDRFVQLYTPLLYQWAQRAGLNETDAADLVQDVMTLLIDKLPRFQYDGQRSFRAWLRTVTLNKWRDQLRRRGAVAAVHDSVALAQAAEPDGVAQFWERDYQQALVRRALRLMQVDFQPHTWRACWELVVAERPAADIARELNMTVGAVHAARSRVLARLRQELAGFLE